MPGDHGLQSQPVEHLLRSGDGRDQGSPLRLIATGASLILACACSPSEPEPPIAPRIFTLSDLETAPPGPAAGVKIEADPPPPYAYWAPAGSVIRNHPTSPGIWFAEIDGEPGPIYFGDECGASRLQGLVGSDLSLETLTFPNGLRDYSLRMPVTADLRPERLNVVRETPGGVILEVKCG